MDLFGGRKLLATFFSSLILAMHVGIGNGFSFNDKDSFYAFCMFTLIAFVYSGIIIFVYGNLSSLAIELLLFFWTKQSTFRTVIFILLHAVFGALPGIYQSQVGLIYPGVVAALLYAVIDVWVKHRAESGKGIMALPGTVFGSLVLIVVVLWIRSEQLT